MGDVTERRSVGDAPPSSLRQSAGMAAIATRARRTNLVRVLELIAVLDLDSPSQGRFSEADEAGCIALCDVLARVL